MEPMKITFLGTSGSVPKKDDNLSSVLVSFKGEGYLFDCPEGTQRQIMNSGHSMMRIKNIFLSHMHADHFLGLFGWIATMEMNQRKEKLTIYSPIGGTEKIKKMLKEIIAKTTFEIEYKQIKRSTILKDENGIEVSAFPLKHNVQCFGFALKEKDKEGTFNRKKAEALGIPVGPLYAKLAAGEKVKHNGKTFTAKDVMDYSQSRKGRKICYVADTRPCADAIKGCEGADVLIHEATFLEEQKDKAIETEHSTALEAAQIAKKAKAKKLFLFHFSARLNDRTLAEDEARKEFKETHAGKAFEEITI
jgi:ribonuclease Z